MRHKVITALFAVLLATLTVGQEAPDPFLMERALPPGALLYFSLPQSPATTEDFAKSNVARFWNHPEIRSFAAPIEKWWLRRKNEGTRQSPPWNEFVKGTAGLSIDEIWGLLQGPLTVAVYDVPLSEEHKLDLVLGLGSPDGAALGKALGSVKEALKKQGAQFQESEFKHEGTTVHQLVLDGFPVFHALVGKTLVLATQQERIEKIISTAADKTAAGLREEAGFRAGKARVAPENRHFAHFHLDVAGILRQFRREIGDESLRLLETLGLSDVTAVSAALSYDGPWIRERYALLAPRRDRGILKFLAGGSPRDGAAAHVPKGALDYGHLGLDLAQAYDVFLGIAKIDADFDEEVRAALEQFEKRVGLNVRAALATVGTSWTWYSAFPEGGGAFPDAVYAISLNDPAKFEEAVEKIAKDAEIPIEETSFRGRRLRHLSVEMPFGEIAPMMDFLRFSYPAVWYVENGLLFLSTNPLALKRQIVRTEAKGPTIADDPKYQALAAKVPAGERESWNYIDFGRVANLLYSTVEPFLHLVRDLPRDPETGELIVDLSRLPLGEVLAEGIGAVLLHKRTTADAIVLESWSNTAVASPTAIAGVAIGAAIAVPGLLAARRGVAGPAGNERVAELSLLFIRQAQETFKSSDSDRNGTPDYWTRDLAGLYALKDASGQILFLLDQETAQADPEGAARYSLDVQPRNGYFFKMLVTDQEGNAYRTDDDKDGNSFTHRTRFGVVAYPAQYGRAGRHTFILNESGRIFRKDTQGQPVDKWPGKSPQDEGWQPTD